MGLKLPSCKFARGFLLNRPNNSGLTPSYLCTYSRLASSLSGNRKLKYIHGNAFENLRNLIKL